MSIEKKSYRTGPYKSIFAQGVQTDNIIYLAGQVGIDEAGNPGADVTEQAKLAYANIRKVLSEFGATMKNVVDETWFVTDVNEILANAETIFESRAEAYGGLPEVSQTLVQVAALILPELKIEIKCIAHI